MTSASASRTRLRFASTFFFANPAPAGNDTVTRPSSTATGRASARNAATMSLLRLMTSMTAGHSSRTRSSDGGSATAGSGAAAGSGATAGSGAATTASTAAAAGSAEATASAVPNAVA